MKTIEYILIGLFISGYAWLWFASLITYTCHAWWNAIEDHRKKMDRKVTEFLTEHQHLSN